MRERGPALIVAVQPAHFVATWIKAATRELAAPKRQAAACGDSPSVRSVDQRSRIAIASASSGLCEALAMVTARGELDRAAAGRFLRDAFIEMRPQAECYVWVGWQSAIAMLGMSDLKILVKKAFDRGFIDSHILGYDHFEQDLRRGMEHLTNPGVQMIATARYSAIP